MKLNILSKRYWYFAFSLLLILPGLILLIVKGMPMGIDFTGGTMMELKFSEGNRPEREVLSQTALDFGIENTVVLSGDTNAIVRTPFLDDNQIESFINFAAET